MIPSLTSSSSQIWIDIHSPKLMALLTVCKFILNAHTQQESQVSNLLRVSGMALVEGRRLQTQSINFIQKMFCWSPALVAPLEVEACWLTGGEAAAPRRTTPGAKGRPLGPFSYQTFTHPQKCKKKHVHTLKLF